tara:strand:+ start:2552 stop:2983 length:432 start_codon:yes stop_codon:yes gene_type:complete
MFAQLRFKLIVWFGRFHGLVLRKSGGRLMYRLIGLNMLLLSTKGRRTGRYRDNPLLYVEHNGNYYSAASFGGNDNHPSWFLNLSLNPEVTILVNRKHLSAIAHVTSEPERTQAWDSLVKCHPGFKNYKKRTTRIIPVVRFDPE